MKTVTISVPNQVINVVTDIIKSMKQKGFTLIELLIVITIIGILASIGLNSFTSAQKKSRDTKRKAHLKQLADSLESYYNDKEHYPADSNGNIIGCGTDAEEECTWGSSVFSNTDTGTIYMIQMPADPTTGLTYYYESFTNIGVITQYHLCARLENNQDISIPKDEDTDEPLVYQDTNCTYDTCNYCISSPNISLPDTEAD